MNDERRKSKVKQILDGIKISLPFAMKAGDELLTAHSSNDEGTAIHQEVGVKNVFEALLKGEVTKEVEELRYAMHLAAEKSTSKTYLGNGIAVDSEVNGQQYKKKYSFYQENKPLTQGMSAIEGVNGEIFVKDAPVEYTVKCDYDELPRFRAEKYLERVKVKADLEKESFRTTLYYYNDNAQPMKNAFFGVLRAIHAGLSGLDTQQAKDSFLSHHDTYGLLKCLKFTTWQATNLQEDGVEFLFYGPHVESITVKDALGEDFTEDLDKVEENKSGDWEYQVVIAWDRLEGCQKLSEKYYSETQAQKYAEKAKKDTSINLLGAKEQMEMERVAYCEECGKEVSIYDANIYQASGLPVLCHECYAKANGLSIDNDIYDDSEAEPEPYFSEEEVLSDDSQENII